MKKLISMILVAVMLCGSMTACSDAKAAPVAKDDTLQIVTTIFPEYDWVMQILGDKAADAEVTMLLDDGVDLHSYQPTVEDIAKIETCDLFIYVGGESDEWVEGALADTTNTNLVAINLMDVLSDTIKEEEVVEGMQAEEHEHDHDQEDGEAHEEGENHEEEEEVEYDEHVWLSLKNASTLVTNISEAMQTIDNANADTYKANADAYVAQLQDLDAQYGAAVSKASQKTVLFGDRFPFRYMVDDYGLEYFAAFVGCSAESEASFETINFLATKVDELGLSTVLTIEGDNHRIAETIVENTKTKDQQILSMDSMQSTTAADVKDGANYLDIMTKNLSVLQQALGMEPEAKASAPDVDLTLMSSIMVYAEVYNMLMVPDEYLGKTIKMDGITAVYKDETTGKVYYSCIVQDATKCCAQGIEFELTDGFDYPSDGENVCVVGVFDSYQEGEYTYFTLRNAEIV
ncbi:MAG: metal ABC transporter substrate-binding protein [Lachnospiraceae bacterium]|nr:metal ABC transporter substrate-binding protein [Lachnospiraceae bacterium]